MISGADHFIILVNDLAQASESFARVGFQVIAGGEHRAFGSHNALVPFGDSTYLELVAFKDPTLAAQTFWGDAVKKLAVREGFGDYAVLSDNVAEDVTAIRQRGLEMSDPKSGARERPDGQRVAWRTARANGKLSSVLPFLIQDDTPRELRIEPPSQGLGKQLRVKEIVVAVDDLASARDAHRAFFGVEPKHVQSTTRDVEGFRVSARWGAVVLAHPLQAANALSDQLEQRGAGLYAITFAADDVNRTRREMTQRGVSVEDDPNGFLIAPAAAHGARIRIARG